MDECNAFSNGLYNEPCLTEEVVQKYVKVVAVSKDHRLASATCSAGNQLKWRMGNYFVKLDCLGYEALAEICACWLLKYIKNKRQSYVEYYPCRVVEDGISLGFGCYAKSFLKDGEEEVTFSSILRDNLQSFAISYDDLRDFMVDATGLDVKNYVDEILCFDSIVRNEDRHFGNFALILDETGYRFAPVFDNGSSCMSDCISFPLDADFQVCIKAVRAKPFSTDFAAQLGFVQPLIIDYAGFLQSVDVRWSSPEFERAIQTIRYGLVAMEGKAWMRY